MGPDSFGEFRLVGEDKTPEIPDTRPRIILKWPFLCAQALNQSAHLPRRRGGVGTTRGYLSFSWSGFVDRKGEVFPH